MLWIKVVFLLFTVVVSDALKAQRDIHLGFETLPFAIDSQVLLHSPYVTIPAGFMPEWVKVDLNPMEYRSMEIAFDTGYTCSILLESRHSLLKEHGCGMLQPHSGRSSLAFSPAYTDFPWEGNDGMYIHELDEPLRKNVRYKIQLKIYIHDHYHEGTSKNRMREL